HLRGPVGAVRGDLQPPRRPPTQRAGRIGTARGGLVMGSDADADSGVAILLDLVMVGTSEALPALSGDGLGRGLRHRDTNQPSGAETVASLRYSDTNRGTPRGTPERKAPIAGAVSGA
ncbi:hypothetical protein, partial [uncultured Lamprocystis sp.]|uniref:hypothetical protein n=1 Tax=uncultured Lamprocystis sp. TaxID=543132 RepID=UPI0025D4C825